MEINNEFLKAFYNSNLCQFDFKDENRKEFDEENSKNSTNSQLTNDDSFEKRNISDEESTLKNDFINRKRIRNKKK